MNSEKLNVGDFGEDVARLHEKIKARGFEISPEEVKRKFYGPATRDAVRECQTCHGLDVTGEVDEATAAMLIPVAGSPAHPIAATPRSPNESQAPALSSGRRTAFRPITPPLRRNDEGEDVINLQDCLQLMLEKQAIQASEEERRSFEEGLKREQEKQLYGDFTAKLVGRFQEQYSTRFHLAVTGETDAPTADALNSLLKELGATGPGQDGAVFEVKGRVASQLRAGVGGLRVEIVDKNVGEDVHLAETVTDVGGAYQATFPVIGLQERCKQWPDLQARAFTGETFLGASEVRYNASDRETLNILLMEEASSALASEHETLIGALTARCRGNLRDLQETDDRQDITYLANKTGWDARAVALAALADQFSARTMNAASAPAIPQEFFYALFRAGIPANEDTLYHTDAKMLEGVWKTASDQGVIPNASTDQIPNLIERFQALSAKKLLAGPALVGASSLKEMLTTSRLNEAQQVKFAQLYAANRSDIPTFWKAVGDSFGQDMANRLQVDGKLGLLTINNAPLMQKVHTTAGANGLSDPLQLAQMGYHRAEAWTQLLTEDLPIPKEVPGDTPETKRANYATYLAAQVRLSYPTAAVAQMVKSGELLLTGAANGVSDQVHAFLSQHQGKFEIGVQPVQQYIAQNNVQVAGETVEQVKRLQRVYQITPSDQALTGLMKRGIDAAYHVVRYDRDTFVQSFAADLGGANDAALTYDKSVQIHNAVLNIALSYLHARTAPAIGVHSPPNVLDPAPVNAGDIIAMATLESLFGSMDFCDCEHCRSILSPAAYLVDLLLFLDEPNPPAGTENPQSVFLERRPDIQHLPLTCENTNTALPYIDVVNETLEYYIVNGLSLQKRLLAEYHGHDTDGAASEDLLASPQFVMDAAYATLRNERFPAPLPFHQPLENLRRYFNKFEVPLPLAMERLRKTDNLERGADPYGWRDILMEEIGLSRAEYEILTDSTAVPLWQMYGFPNATTNADVIAVIAELSNAKRFAHRVGITYDELVSILKTRFINPNGDLIPKLERLGVQFAMLKALKDGAIADSDFDKLLADVTVPADPAEYGEDIKKWVKDDANYAHIMGLILLTDTSAEQDPCRFDTLEFRYAEPMASLPDSSTRLGTVEFVRLLRFIRMWKKLGWTIDQADAAICALYRADLAPLIASDINDVTKVNAGFLTLLPRLGIVMRVTKALNLTVKRDLLSLLACWSDIGAHGNTALYRLMFLNPAVLEQDAVFADNGYGEFLADDPLHPKKIAEHVEALRAAFHLTGEELFLIAADLGFKILLGVSYKHPQPTLEQAILNAAPGIGYDDLRKQLFYAGVLSIQTHDTLKAVAGVSAEFQTAVDALYAENPTLTVLNISNISAIYRRGWLARKLKLSVRELLLLIQLTGLDPFTVPDPTNPAILQIISLVQALKDRSLKSAVALYLIWNQDLSGKSAPDPAQMAELARTLRGDFAGIDDQFAVIEDPNGDVARARMSLVYGPETSDAFFELLDNALVVDVAYTHSAAAIEPAITAADPRIAYDDFHHRLSHKGLMTTTMQTALKNVGGVSVDFQSAVDALFARSEETKGLFFNRYPELKAPYNIAVAEPPANRHRAFLAAFQPDLSRRRKRQQALQRLSAAAGVDLVFTQTILDPATAAYPLHAAGDQNKPALDDVLALQIQGFAAQFFFRDTATGNVDQSISAAANLDYANGGNNPLPNPGNAISGIWSGQVEAPEAGFYNFVIQADTGATVTLTLDGQARALTRNGKVWRNTDPIELKAGTLYKTALRVEKVKGALSLKWETPKRGREVIPSRYLYPPTILTPFANIYIRFLKTASLALGLRLTADEVAYFATNADYQINGDGWLNVLPANGAPATSTANALLKPFQAVLDYTRIKAEISPDDESLLTALREPTTATQNPDGLLFTITRWNQSSLDDVLAQFSGNIVGLGDFDLFSRVHDAFALIQKMGISAKALIQATTNEPISNLVGDLQAALRARYEAADWRDVVRPMNDEMRSLQRDALVAYILHQMRSHPESAHIDTPDKLFEYFLTDVQMDPCMQTSRIRHALSSVQLFTERCLMKLEPRVSPAAINAKQWVWMKRYRVWEANRKVYLFPENWLEPELRDDKSPFFKEIEGELLQSDITEDTAATALLNYLSKLEEVAKLEPCGIYHVDGDLSKRTGDVDHVIARTAGAHRKYYYRRHEYVYWTPWEQIKLDIEDNPVIPVVWNDRLFLFWLRILKQPDTPPDPFPKTDRDLASLKTSEIKTKQPPKVTVQAVLCWSEYYNGRWQATKTSDVGKPLELWPIDPTAGQSFDRSALYLSAMERQDYLEVRISNQAIVPSPYDSPAAIYSFILYNTHSSPTPFRITTGSMGVTIFPGRRTRDLNISGNVFTTTYAGSSTSVAPRKVLENSMSSYTTEPLHVLKDSWGAPFFYQDSRHVFFVTTEDHRVSITDPDYTVDYGAAVAPRVTQSAPIPPLILQTDPSLQIAPKFWGDGGPVGRLHIIDPAPIRRYVTEDAYIRQGIGTTGSVMYGDRQIGPSGALQNGRAGV